MNTERLNYKANYLTGKRAILHQNYIRDRLVLADRVWVKIHPISTNDPTTGTASNVQPAVKHLPDGIQSSSYHDVTHFLHSPPATKSNLEPHLQLTLKNLKAKTQRLTILPAYKGNSIVILTHKQYHNNLQEHIDTGPTDQ